MTRAPRDRAADAEVPVARTAGARGLPHPALRSFVRGYQGYRITGLPPGLHLGLPGPTLTMIVALDRPLDIAEAPDPAAGSGRHEALVGGLHQRRALIAHDGCMEGVQVDLHPLGARALLGLPAAALTHQVVRLDDVLGTVTDELRDRLLAALTWSQRFSVLDEVLCRGLQPERATARPELDWAWQRLVHTAGRIDVARLAHEIGWSTRHLRSCFGAEVGLGPKATARVLRFDRARRLLQRSPRPSLADVAATCGYADQAHLTRDFRGTVDCTPGRLLATDPLLARYLAPDPRG